jgi:hypothetical protein
MPRRSARKREEINRLIRAPGARWMAAPDNPAVILVAGRLRQEGARRTGEG